MKKQTLTLLLVFMLSITAFGQKKQAYCIAKNGEKIEGSVPSNAALFLNDSSTKIIFENGDQKNSILIGEIQEFGFVGETKHVRLDALVNDFSINSDYTSNPNVILSKKNMILQVLLEGSVSLYVLPSENGYKFFYKEANSKEANQLIYSKFLNENGAIKENKEYQKTLFDKFNCRQRSVTEFVKIKYTAKELTDFFQDYLICKNEKPVTVYRPLERKESYSVAVNMGFYQSKYNVINQENIPTSGSVLAPSLGAEFEVLSSKKIFALFFSLNYLRINDESSVTYTKQSNTTINTHLDRYTYDYQMLLAHAGIRLYLTPNRQVKCFIDAAIGASLTTGEFIVSESMSNVNGNNIYNPITRKISPVSMPQFAIGAEYKNVGLRVAFTTAPGMIKENIDRYAIDFKGMMLASLSYRFKL